VGCPQREKKDGWPEDLANIKNGMNQDGNASDCMLAA